MVIEKQKRSTVGWKRPSYPGPAALPCRVTVPCSRSLVCGHFQGSFFQPRPRWVPWTHLCLAQPLKMGTCGSAQKGPFHRSSWAEAACQHCARGGGRKHRLYLVHHSAHHDIPKADLQAGIHREEGSVQLQGVGHPQNLCSNMNGALKIEDLIHAKEPMGSHFQLKPRKAHQGCSH